MFGSGVAQVQKSTIFARAFTHCPANLLLAGCTDCAPSVGVDMCARLELKENNAPCSAAQCELPMDLLLRSVRFTVCLKALTCTDTESITHTYKRTQTKQMRERIQQHHKQCRNKTEQQKLNTILRSHDILLSFVARLLLSRFRCESIERKCGWNWRICVWVCVCIIHTDIYIYFIECRTRKTTSLMNWLKRVYFSSP